MAGFATSTATGGGRSGSADLRLQVRAGPGLNGKMRARFIGDDPEVLRLLGDEAMAILAHDLYARGSRTTGGRVKVFCPATAEEAADLGGVERREIAFAARGLEGERSARLAMATCCCRSSPGRR